MAPDYSITPELVTAYSLCQRKAFLQLRGDTGDPPHEYTTLLKRHACNRQSNYHDSLREAGFSLQQDEEYSPLDNADVIAKAELKTGDLKATVDALVRSRILGNQGSKTNDCYEPHLVVGTHAITKEQKIQLAFMAHVLHQAKRARAETGVVVNVAGEVFRFRLLQLITELAPILSTLRTWLVNLPSKPPPIFLNDHCSICTFKSSCLDQAEREDNLSLLDRMTPKVIQRYHKKGIFTVHQLSYLFKPRRQRSKRARSPSGFNLELQALALRTAKTYVHQPPLMPVHPTEIFLDIEGIPDYGTHYLIGLIICSQNKREHCSFWADSPADEEHIFRSLLKTIEEHPGAPIYHYGSYEPKALERAEKKYTLDCTSIRDRLVNVNPFIFGKIYFPARSNTLKDLGRLVGATWSSSDPSGLQSVVWRFQWEETKSGALKEQLLTYNLEDCEALRLLVAELHSIGQAATVRSDIDFADAPKQQTTMSGQQIHDSLEGILRSAHADYDKKRIKIQSERTEEGGQRNPGASKGHPGYRRIAPSRPGRIIRVRRAICCPRHKGQPLRPTDKLAEHTIIDLAFTKNGCRKTVVKYVGTVSCCSYCNREFLPPAIKRFKGRLFGHRFRAWMVYQRVILRLPYRVMSQVVEDLFSEQISEGSTVNFMADLANYYVPTEKLLLKKILSSPFLHADETKINIRGIDHYVWVLTDGVHVIFRLTETREATWVQNLLDGYGGVLISDFYAGYDSCRCRQQKCLVHLIRDLNDDLWKNPYNAELEDFIGAFKEVLVPIMIDIEKYGLKRWHLHKHRKLVDRFYRNVVERRDCVDEIIQKYQKRFGRYRESLFRFLEEDSIPWNNNAAERASRHLAIQRKISGSFSERGATQYLRLLAVAQSCRFQEKSFLHFLLSGERDVDQFRERRRNSNSSEPIGSTRP